MIRYKVALTETTTATDNSTRHVRDLVALDVPEALVPELRSLILKAVSGYAFPPAPEGTQS